MSVQTQFTCLVWGSSPYQGNVTWWIYRKTRTSKLWTRGVTSEVVKLCLCLSVSVCSLPTLCSDHGNQPQWCGVCVLFMIPIDSSGLNLLLWVFQGSIMEYCQQVKGNFVFVKVNVMKTYQCLKIWDTAYNNMFSSILTALGLFHASPLSAQNCT